MVGESKIWKWNIREGKTWIVLEVRWPLRGWLYKKQGCWMELDLEWKLNISYTLNRRYYMIAMVAQWVESSYNEKHFISSHNAHLIFKTQLRTIWFPSYVFLTLLIISFPNFTFPGAPYRNFLLYSSLVIPANLILLSSNNNIISSIKVHPDVLY